MNGGTCENLCGDYRCHCTEGNQGTHCDGGKQLALISSNAFKHLVKHSSTRHIACNYIIS